MDDTTTNIDWLRSQTRARLFDAVMINAGTMIASAIFIVPASVAAAVQGTA